MLIKFTKLAAGPGGVYPPGSVADLDKKQAEQIIAAGAAVYCGPPEAEKSKQPEKQPAKLPAKKAVKK